MCHAKRLVLRREDATFDKVQQASAYIYHIMRLRNRFPLPHSRFIEYALKESALGKLLFWTKGEERRGVLIGLYRLSSLNLVQRLSQATRLHHCSGLLGTCDAKVRGRSQQLKTRDPIKVESLTDRKTRVGSRKNWFHAFNVRLETIKAVPKSPTVRVVSYTRDQWPYLIATQRMIV